MRLFDFAFQQVSIPYEQTVLPGYLYLVDGTGAPRPTVIYNSGYDSTAEESYFAIAAAALARGYNVLAFDGPGQGAALREQRLVFRPDWEAVITPVVDFALTRHEIAPAPKSACSHTAWAVIWSPERQPSNPVLPRSFSTTASTTFTPL